MRTITEGRKALLLRVGIDRGTGGVLSPIFPDGSFEYVTIPEEQGTRCPLTFRSLPARHGGFVAQFLPGRFAALHPHIDPDFEAWTYGDAAPRKRRQLLRLRPGDLLVFYAGFEPRPADDVPRLHVIGWLAVKEVLDLGPQQIAPRSALSRRFGNTAHFLRDPPDPRFALVAGEPGRSRLLRRALPLGDGRDCMLRDLAALGYTGSLRRAVGHWISGAALPSLQAWLQRGPAGLIDGRSRLLRVAPAALRAAPDDRGDLAIADPRPEPGDWVYAAEEDAGVGFALARINRRRPGGEGRASLYWSVRSAAPRNLAGGAPHPAEGSEALRRLVSRIASRWRAGFVTLR